MLECRFGISTVVVGDGREEVHETKVVNRIIRMDHEGWHCEADQRHGELIVKALNLHEAKSVSTPGGNEKSWQEEEDRERLNNQDASQYRALAASANYLALDRTDVQYAVKEICRGDEQTHPRGPPSSAEAWALPRRAAPEASGASSSRTPAES